MGIRSFMRSLAPGNDAELAADLSTQRRASYWRSGVSKAAAEGDAWEDADRARDRRGDRHTDWDD
jgi:hypothetical protein